MSDQNKEQRTVVSGVLSRGDKYLLVQRSQKEEHFPGLYEFPGGKIDFGESAEQALKREFSEETGLDVEEGEIIRSFTYNSPDDNRHFVEFVYHVNLKNPSLSDVSLSDEHDDFKWISLSEIPHYTMSEEVINTFKRLGYDENKKSDKHKLDVENTSTTEIHIFTDGGSRGNPGPSASGYVLMTPDEEIIEEGGEYLGVTTNNQAEYQAVKLALEMVEKYQPTKIRFFIDSLLVVNQMNGIYKIRNRELWPIHERIKELAAKYDDVTYTHVRRELNKLADGKVNEVLDSYEHH